MQFSTMGGCESDGHSMGTRSKHAFTDALSLSIERRLALDRLMNDTRKRRFDCVLAWRFDRFARSANHILIALEEFRSLGIRFISYQGNIDTTSPLGQALFTIVSVVAQLERDLIRERVKAGLRNATAKGRVLGRPRVAADARAVVQAALSGTLVGRVCLRLKLSRGTAQRAARAFSARR